MTVLLVTRSDDNECVPFVTAALRERGAEVFRFDTDRFPTQVRLVSRYDGPAEELRLVAGGAEVRVQDVTAVWIRRIHTGNDIPRTLDAQIRGASVLESRKTVQGFLASLNVFQLDPLPATFHARNKQLQLQVAREVGLETPRTLITNDPDAVRAFAGSCEGGLVAKMLSSFAIDEEGQEKVVFTNPVSPEDLEQLDGLRLCPMTFQERIPKALELRTTIVGPYAFTASIDSQSSEFARNDWRRDGLGLVESWKPYTLPRDVELRLFRLMDRFGLNYGAVDFILTPDGRHVFLEVNPVGEFFWLERWPGFPIAAAIADVLLGRAGRQTRAG
jgi:MvdD family ATP-grasp ribosomal peptide maturase